MIKNNRDGARWINITKACLLFEPYDKVRFLQPSLGIKKFFGLKLMKNCRFKVYKINNRIKWTIRLPFFYWERGSNDWKFGTNGIYLWWHIARTR